MLPDLNLPTQSHSEVKWSESHPNSEAGTAVRALGKMQGLLPRGGLDSSQGTRAGARGLGSHLVLSYILCILFAAESWTKYKKLVTGLAAGRMRNWMGRSAPEECLAHSSYFQNFPALAGVKLCGHHPPCQGDSALTREHSGEVPCVPVTEEGTMDVSSKDSLQASRLDLLQSRSVLASSERWGKVTRQSLSPPFFLEGSVGTKCLIPQGENIWKDKERGRSPAYIHETEAFECRLPRLPCPVCA